MIAPEIIRTWVQYSEEVGIVNDAHNEILDGNIRNNVRYFTLQDVSY